MDRTQNRGGVLKFPKINHNKQHSWLYLIYFIFRNFRRYKISWSSLVYNLLQTSKLTWPLNLVLEEFSLWIQCHAFAKYSIKITYFKEWHYPKSFAIYFKPVDKVKLFKILFTIPSVFHELSNSSKLNIFWSPKWTTRRLHGNEF